MGIGMELETLYKLLCSTMMDAFGAIDMAGRYQEANQAFLDLVGYEKEELIELSRQELTPERQGIGPQAEIPAPGPQNAFHVRLYDQRDCPPWGLAQRRPLHLQTFQYQ